MAAQLTAEFEARFLPETGGTEVQAAAVPIYGSFAEQMQRMQTAQAGKGGAMATPLFAHAWAEAIIMFWQFGVASGGIDPTKPLYLMDLAPDQGQLAWLLLNALRTKLTADKRDWQVCIVACCTTVNAADTLLGHPYLTDYVKDGWFDAALFDARDDGGLTLLQRHISLLHTDNPLVILSLEYFQTLPSELAAAHYGTLLQGTLALRPQDDMPSTLDLDYQWSPAEPHATNDMLLPMLTDYYLTHFHNAAVLLPCAAAAVLQRLQIMAAGRYLLLAADPGVCDEQAIRLGALMPPVRWARDSVRLPVNYHALSLLQRQSGARVWNSQQEDDGIVLHVAWHEADDVPDNHCFDAITARLDAAHPSHAIALRQIIANVDGAVPLTASSMLTLLRQSQHDPALLKLALNSLLRQPSALTGFARREWQNAVAATWDNVMPLQQCDGLHCQIALFAMQIGYWGLARDCLSLGLEFYGDDVHDLYLLAWCEATTGASVSALSRLEHALALAPDHAPARALQAELMEKISRWQNTAWYLPLLASDRELCIEPLGQEHAADMLYQYRDEQIGVMTRLPDMCTIEEAQTWIAAQTEETGRRTYAVMHACWGLVGVVSCHCAQQTGYFYFWTGSDYQQCGFGQRAARLLFAQLAGTGVSGIYTSVDKVNRHSQYLMEKFGFIQIEVRAAPPDDMQYFYYFGTELDATKQSTDFLELCKAIDCPIQMIDTCCAM